MTAIRVELQLADGSFTTGLLRAGQSLAQFERELIRTNPRLQAYAQNGQSVIKSMTRATDANRSFLSSLRDITIVTGALSMGIGAVSRAANGWLGQIVKVNAEMERLTMLMTGMSTKQNPFEDAASNVEYLREQARQMPFSLNAMSSAFVKLKATGIDPTSGAFKALVDGVAAFGGTDQQLERIVLGITQMSGKGVIQMEELRQQLGESMPGAMQLMARSMGVSVAQLTKAIATGTVEAKSALEQFYAEVERSYGGSAQRMMESFNGQVSQLKTNLQMLVTGEGGRGFFQAVKGELIAINEFLRSDFASAIAQKMGTALTAVMQGFRELVAWVWKFRDEIATLAASGGLIWLAGVANSAFGAIAGAINSTRVTMVAFSRAMAEAGSMIALGATGFRSLSTALIGVQMSALGAATALRAIVMAIPVLGAITVGLGSALMLLRDFFKSTAEAARDAYEEMIEFGNQTEAATRQIIDNYKATLDAEEQQILSTIENIKQAMENPPRGTSVEQHQRILEYWLKKYEELQQRRVKVEEESEDALRKARERDRDQRLRELERENNEKIGILRAQYLRQSELDRKAFDDAIRNARQTGEAISKIEEDYGVLTIQRGIELEEKIREVYMNSRQALIAELERSGVEASIGLAGIITAIDDQIKATDQRIENLRTQERGIKSQKAPEDQSKAIERGKKALASLQRDIAAVWAEFNGASGAAAEMMQRIANGDFGSIKEGGEEVAKLHQALLDAAEAKEALDELMDGRKEVYRELDRIRDDLFEKELELFERKSGRKLSDAEKLIMRMDAGLIKGFGKNSETQRLIEAAARGLTQNAEAAAKVGDAIRDDAFGQQSLNAIDEATNRFQRLLGVVSQTGDTISGLNFSGFSPGGVANDLLTGIYGGGNRITRHAGSFLDLIARAEGTDKGRGYNETLAYGRFTGGPVDLVNMTLDEIDRLQTQMLRHPGNYFNSSAVGRYQIVQTTLRSLRKKLGLSGDELFTPDLQDRLALELMRGRGANVEGLRNEWEGLRRVDANVILQAYNNQASYNAGVGPTREAAAALNEQANAQARLNEEKTKTQQLTEQQAKIEADVRETAGQYQEKALDLARRTGQQNVAEYAKKIQRDIERAKSGVDEIGKHYERLVDDIEAGKLFDTIRDANDPVYADLIKLAKELDAAEKKRKETQDAIKDAKREEEQFNKKELELAERLREAREKSRNPDYKGESDELRKLRMELDEYVELKKKAYGEDSAEYKAALDFRTNQLRQFGQVEAYEQAAKWAKERRDFETSMMSQTQIRQREMQRQLALLDRWVEDARKAGLSEEEITEQVERRKAQIRAQYAMQSPLARQMKEWSDFQGQLEQATTRWMDSLAGGLADLIMGTGDLRSVIQGILKDIINMGIKYLMSNIMGSKGKMAAVAPRGGKGGGKGKMLGKGLFGLFHTGGIVGSTPPRARLAPLGLFANAPKFHGGGIVGGPKLLPSEVPIIAKKGEGVFTPEQMEAMGSFKQPMAFQINAPITVNGSAGTPEQNQDLANRMAKEMEVTMRTIIADEVRKQQRPGNALNRRSR